MGISASSEVAAEETIDLQREFESSLKLAQKLLIRLQSLIHTFKQERLSGSYMPLFHDWSMLPKVELKFQEWLHISDAQRLRFLAESCEDYKNLLDQVYAYEHDKGDPALSESIDNASLDLRDLLHHIHLQMSVLGVDAHRVGQSRVLGNILKQKSIWGIYEKAFLILKSIEQFVQRAVRDYTVLRSSAKRNAGLH
uniref:Interleukin-27 subunit alpha n=1 Tax=Geotrypetes seraphini TaxID=260995 RepID=A0A6P8RCV7_GEOSA|nr:interleukin-27 subunit alpha [Geotrypetes seraphini]